MRTVISLILGICIGAVIGLGALRLNQPAHTMVASSSTQVPRAAPKPAALPPKPPPASRWAVIESTNYAEYVANLKACGCPLETISSIIRADITAALGTTASRDGRFDPSAFDARMKQIRRQMDALGLPPSPEPGDYFFTSEQLSAIREGLRKFPLLPSEVRTGPSRERQLQFPHLAEKSAENSNQRRQLLGSITPDQLIDYKSEFEKYGETVVAALAGFIPTQTEYYAMITAMDANTPDALTNKLSSILPPARYAEFLANQTPENLAAFNFCASHPEIHSKVAPQLRQILKNRSNLSYQEYRNQLRALLNRDNFDEFLSDNP